MTNTLLHKAMKRSILSHLILCTLVSLPAPLQAASSSYQLGTKECIDNIEILAPKVTLSIESKLQLDEEIEGMPLELTKIAAKIHTPSHTPQLLAVVTHDTIPTKHPYRKYLFASNGLLTGKIAQSIAYDLSYHLVSAPEWPVIWQLLSFLGQQFQLKVEQCILPMESPLCMQCGHIATYLFDQDLIMKKSGCQGHPWPMIPPPVEMVNGFYSSHFSEKQRQMTIASVVGNIFTKNDIAIASHHSEDHQKKADKAPQQDLFPPGQLLIPANGQCLYTSIIMGYLLPVREEADTLIERIDQLFGFQPAGYINQLCQVQQNLTLYFTYLHSNAFSVLLTAFMARMQIKKGTWGGPQEIQTIANKLKVNIQEYYPDPSNRTTLLASDLTSPTEAEANITLHIVRDKVHPAEVVTQAEKASAQDNPHYQHYRLKYALPPSILDKILPSTQPLIPHYIGSSQQTSFDAKDWFAAAKKGNRKLLAELYNRHNVNINTRNKKGYTALLLSAWSGYLDCIVFLLQQGADIHAKNKLGNTPLILSAHQGHFDCVKYLVEQGADITWKGKNSKTALQWTEESDQTGQDIANYLSNKPKELKEWFEAAKTGNRALLKDNNYNINVNTRSPKGNTALLYSAFYGHLDCVKFLFQQGADINVENTKGNTALLYSVQHGHLDCLKYLLQQGADINHKNKMGYPPLLLSAQQGHLDCVQFLVQQGANIDARDNEKNTPLILSVQQEHLACINYLVKQGANINLKNKQGNTPLILSVQKKQLSYVKYLVGKGADITLKGKDRKTALTLAKEAGKEGRSIARYLSKKTSQLEKWFETAKKGDRESLAALYEQHKINVNTRNQDTNTALLYSALYGRLDNLKWLYQQGANIKVKNKQGNTALILSSQKKHLDCAKFLLLQGADINGKNKIGNTALIYSAFYGHLDNLKWLCQKGANIHEKNAKGNTALLLSAQTGHLDCVKYLLQQGADINDKNTYENTPLILSAHEGYLGCVKLFLEQGADINAKNVYGNTPLILSAYNEHFDCVNFLLKSVDLHKLSLQGVDLRQATLPKDLSGMNFTDAKLPENLSNVKFTGSKLPKDLANRDLTGADLSGHHFTGTNFDGAQLKDVQLANTLCDYQQSFQDNINANKKKSIKSHIWCQEHLPEDLKSIAKVYPLLSQDSHKAELLQVASGLAYLPCWKGTEFNIKAVYWSCKLLTLKNKLSSDLGEELLCSLESSLVWDAERYCWRTAYPQAQEKKPPRSKSHNYLAIFEKGWQKYKCKSIETGGDQWYKNNITENIKGLLRAYAQLTNKKRELKKEAATIALQLSDLYQYQHWDLLFHYLTLQNRLIRLKTLAGEKVGAQIHYNSTCVSTLHIWMMSE